MLSSHKRSKRQLETRITAISFDEADAAGYDPDDRDPLLIEWKRDGDRLFRLETLTGAGYHNEDEVSVSRQRTSVRKALREAIPAYPRLWIEGLSNQEIVRLLTHYEYFELVHAQADNEEGFLVNNSVHFLTDGHDLIFRHGEDYMHHHFRFYPSKSPGGPWYQDECDWCFCTGIDPDTERGCEICEGIGFLSEQR